MRTVSLIVDQTYAKNRFIETFRLLNQKDQWLIEDEIRIDVRESDRQIKSKMANLDDNKSKVVVVFCPVPLFRRVVAAAKFLDLFASGNGWFYVDHFFDFNEETMHDLPIGLVGIQRLVVPNSDYQDLIKDAVRLVATATESLSTDQSTSFQYIVNRHPSCNRAVDRDSIRHAQSYYRYLNASIFTGDSGFIGFDRYGSRDSGDFTVMNLVNGDKDSKEWRKVGEIKNNSVQLDSIMWLGKSLLGPTVDGKRRLRVVTNLVMPFVMKQEPFAEDQSCVTAVPCLELYTNNATTIEGIFHDYRNNIHNPSRPYKKFCCSGLSMSLLQRLAKDLNFDFETYTVADGHYGAIDDADGRWNGMVHDLLTGAADMAVAAFSITVSRMYVIDFSEHYFQSGYSILVAKKEMPTPINAIFEPFGIGEWLGIAGAAQVAAIAMALLEWNSPFGLSPHGRRRDKNYTLASAMNMVWAILFGHMVKTKTPKSWPAKFLQNCWASASIFIIASYTANIASYIAGKRLPPDYSGINDPRLLHEKVHVAAIEGVAINDFLTYKTELNRKIQYINKTEVPIEDLVSNKIDAYLDDTPVLTYAKNKMDTNCTLKLVGKPFGEDGYGIGFKKHSALQEEFSKILIQYRDSGYIEDLRREFFSTAPCMTPRKDRNELSFSIKHLAGIFVMISTGVIVSLLLLILEHVVFKYTIPYLRRKPSISALKSIKLMFFSQRMYRIVHSSELVSPNHSAKEMVTVLKKRQFEKLFQKKSGKVHKEAPQPSKGKLFDLSNQLIWLRRQTPASSPSSGTTTSKSGKAQGISKATQTVTPEYSPLHEVVLHHMDSDNEYIEMDDLTNHWQDNWESEWPRTEGLNGVDVDNHSFYKNETFSLEDEDNPGLSEARGEGDGGMDVDVSPQEGPSVAHTMNTRDSGIDSGVIISPRGSPFGRETNAANLPKHSKRRSILSSSSAKEKPTTKDNKVKSMSKDKCAAIRNGILRADDRRTLDSVSKDDLVKMWRRSEYELNKEVRKLKEEKARLEARLDAFSGISEVTDCHWV